MKLTLRGQRRLPTVLVVVVVGSVLAVGVLVAYRTGEATGVQTAPAVGAQGKALLRSAEERLVHECMSAAGFQYFERPPATKSDQRDFPYVVDDVAWAAANGYGRPEQTAPPVDPAARYFAGLPKEQQNAWRKTLVGSGKQISVELAPGRRLSASDKGCIASARRTLYGDLVGWFKARRLTDNLDFLVQDKVRDDQRYVTAMADWAGCVKGRGYDAADPGALREVVAKRNEGRAASVVRAAEVEATVAEATCANSTSLTRTLRSIEPGYRAAAIAEHQRELADLNVLEQAAVPRAKAALENH
ncbi:hypothetical protein [Streptomyces sp. SID13031]|uniref:hypothetical protein n=1 Tax=Streptomyces sp. SID13031 TaxID=2706046 RepID=UPI0013C6FC8E|nr:hypothetical protein [Streptomyces sp. SID13031]NEA31709.1 hypothetical protein [Streptomyces sp. SID13031]